MFATRTVPLKVISSSCATQNSSVTCQTDGFQSINVFIHSFIRFTNEPIKQRQTETEQAGVLELGHQKRYLERECRHLMI